jgi:hypothetical protein
MFRQQRSGFLGRARRDDRPGWFRRLAVVLAGSALGVLISQALAMEAGQRSRSRARRASSRERELPPYGDAELRDDIVADLQQSTVRVTSGN